MLDNKIKSVSETVMKVINLQEKVTVKKEYDDKHEAEHGVYHNGKKIGYVVHDKKSNTHTAYHGPQGDDGEEDYGHIDDHDSHADAVNTIKHSAGVPVHEEIDPKKRTKDTLKGANEPTKQKDDVGPGSDGKSTKVKYRPGPLATEGFKDKLLNWIGEANEEMLSRYMKSRGYNPSTTTKDKKIAIVKSNEFKKWMNDHQFEETEVETDNVEELIEMVNEVLSKDAKAADWIHDFVHSDNPKFEGKSKKKRMKMALAAYYSKQRNEDWEAEPETKEPEAKDDAKLKAQAQKTKKDLDKISKAFSKKNEEVELEEGRQPETDNVPFVAPYTDVKPDVKDKGTSGSHTPFSRVRHLARTAMDKVKKEVVDK
jgi:hypothetical protein